MNKREIARVRRDEKRWLQSYKPRSGIPGSNIYTTPAHVYEPMGGFRLLHANYKQWLKEDSSIGD